MRLCVIGDPVGHSLSPRIHRRFMERCGAAGSYEAVTVTAETLEDLVVQGCRGAWDGCNVTMPLKERILPLLDAVEPWTASCGAVNTVCFRNGRAVGYNTDGPGVVESLRLRGFAPAGQAALVLGAGGAAKAAALALAQAGCRVTVCARTPEKAAALAARVRRCDCLMEDLPVPPQSMGCCSTPHRWAWRVRRSSSLWISYRRCRRRRWYTMWCTIPRTQL